MVQPSWEGAGGGWGMNEDDGEVYRPSAWGAMRLLWDAEDLQSDLWIARFQIRRGRRMAVDAHRLLRVVAARRRIRRVRHAFEDVLAEFVVRARRLRQLQAETEREYIGTFGARFFRHCLEQVARGAVDVIVGDSIGYHARAVCDDRKCLIGRVMRVVESLFSILSGWVGGSSTGASPAKRILDAR